MADLIPTRHDDTLAVAGHTSPAAAYLASLSSPRSRKTMLGCLERIAGMATDGQGDAWSFQWERLRHAHTAAIRSALAARYPNANTANVHLAALRGVLKAAWRLGLVSGEEYQRATDVAPVRGSSLPSGRSLGGGELRALFEACAGDETPGGRRDAALLALLYGAGLRRAEAASLDLADLDRQTGALKVRGKGSKERLVYLTGGALQAVLDWLAVRGDLAGPLLMAVNKGGRIAQGRRLTDQAVYGALRKRARQAGVSSLSPHDLRRSHVSDLLDGGADLTLVQRLVGHASPTTTSRYDRRPERAKQRAAGLLHVPYDCHDGKAAL